jgi:hypothetical protein
MEVTVNIHKRLGGTSGAGWKYFVGSCILAGGLLLKAGVPIAPIVLGIAAAAYFNWKRLASRP